MVKHCVRLVDLDDINVAHLSPLAFLHHPAHIVELRICDVVAAVTERTYVHLTCHLAVKHDAQLAVHHDDVEVMFVSDQETVSHLKALEYLSRLVLLGVACPVDIYALAFAVQLHADE